MQKKARRKQHSYFIRRSWFPIGLLNFIKINLQSEGLHQVPDNEFQNDRTEQWTNIHTYLYRYIECENYGRQWRQKHFIWRLRGNKVSENTDSPFSGNQNICLPIRSSNYFWLLYMYNTHNLAYIHAHMSKHTHMQYCLQADIMDYI